MHLAYNKHNKSAINAVSIWLFIMCLALLAMIFIGGLTRLTESGLSMTDWNPVSGIIPPQDEIGWNIEFDKYKQSPEYIHHNFGMSLQEFKSIYWLEFIHRIAGRIIGLIYILPLTFFLIRGHILGKDVRTYIGASVLLAMQGLMGWYMVKSGLISNPYVSHYRLAAHLMIAVFLYIIIFWQLLKNSCDIMLAPLAAKLSKLSFWCFVCIILLLIQIMLGGFVAGLKAGLIYNNFPMMGDSFIPHEIYESKLSLSNIFSFFSLANFSDPVFVQFIHRIIAYILFSTICVFCLYAVRFKNKKLSYVALYVFLAMILQITLGVLTLIYRVPLSFALLHQLGAIILLSFLLWAYFLIKNSHCENQKLYIKH